MLAEAGRRASGSAPLVEAAAEITSRMPGLVVDHLERLLAREGLKLDGARVLLIGVGFKIDCVDTAATPARDVVRALRQRGLGRSSWTAVSPHWRLTANQSSASKRTR
jgi:UDP-N-acetyl-D-mannosaminuronate dehydrogenase